jgi:hypothetical protein
VADSWAQAEFAQANMLATFEPAYAIADAWCAPHLLSVDPDTCERLRHAAAAVAPIAGGNGKYHLLEPADADRAQIVARFEEANARWWNLDIDRWEIHAKRYDVGDRHAPHQDLHPGAAGRKIAGSIQLSAPGSYRGGELVVHFAHHRIPMPRELGTLVAMPGWTVHEVERVNSGTRWALIVNGFGPPLR